MPQFVADTVDLFAKLWRALGNVLGRQRRYERRAHHRAVLVGDVGVAGDGVAALVETGEGRERRAEEKEGDAAREVEALYPPEDGERRVVDHNRIGGIVEALVVAARVERAHEPRSVDAPSLLNVGVDHFHDLWRRVAVVGRFLRLELLDEPVVVEEALLALAHRGQSIGLSRLAISSATSTSVSS